MGSCLLAYLLISILCSVNAPKPNPSTGVLLIGGKDARQCLRTLEFFSPSSHRSKAVRITLSVARCAAASAMLDNDRVIVIGGKSVDDNKHILDSTEIIDVAKGRTTRGPRLRQARAQAAASVLQNEPWVCGGHDKTGAALDNCEVLQRGRSWYLNRSKRLKHPRIGLSLVTLGDTLYAIGGSSKNGEALNSVEKYKGSSWRETRSPMSFKRQAMGAAVFGGKIYVCGGMEANKAKKECEMYEESRRRWKKIASMSTPRAMFSFHEVDGKLFALGGGSGNIEFYDPKSRRWRSERGRLATKNRKEMTSVANHFKSIRGI